MKKKILLIIIPILIIICFIIIYHNTKSMKTNYNNLDLKNYHKIMIVAHPDDETLWGGSRLIKDDYVVVCITCGTDEARVKEITSVLQSTNDILIMLNYPDKEYGERSNWNDYRNDITNDLKNILNLKDWELIVTHNPDGEYGHIHHRMTSKMITDLADKSKLYYFGKYYSKAKMDELTILPPQIDDDILSQKKEILKKYKTQESTVNKFAHMHPYEDWVAYNEWMAK